MHHFRGVAHHFKETLGYRLHFIEVTAIESNPLAILQLVLLHHEVDHFMMMALVFAGVTRGLPVPIKVVFHRIMLHRILVALQILEGGHPKT